MPTWETTADWDAAQSETGVRHEQPTGTDWSASDTLEKGYPSLLSGYGMDVLAYYPLAEPSGTTANDVSAQGTNGTYNGTTQQTSGPLSSNYRSFDGTDDYVDCNTAYGGTLDMVGVTAWVRVSAWQNAYEAVISDQDDDAAEWFVGRDNTSNRFRIKADGVSWQNSTSGRDIAGDGWVHLHAQIESGNVVELYLDGAIDIDQGIGAVDFSDDDFNHNLGRTPGYGGVDHWANDMAHVVVWGGTTASNSLLTQAEVQELMDAFI